MIRVEVRGNETSEQPNYSTLDRDGFQAIRNVLSSSEVATLINAIESAEHVHGRHRGDSQFAIRRLTEAVPLIATLPRNPRIARITRDILGDNAMLVRGILFDKTPAANWAVPPHQDTTIAVRERIDAPGFGPWSIKAGIPHVQPPREILESMATLRLHLDDCPTDAGALRVMPGSHRLGILTADQIAACSREAEFVACPAAAGDCLLMRPLLVHSSKPASLPTHRRVVHLEFAAGELFGGLRWCET